MYIRARARRRCVTVFFLAGGGLNHGLGGCEDEKKCEGEGG